MTTPSVNIDEGDAFLLAAASALNCRDVAERAIAERDRRRQLGEEAVILWDTEKGVLSIAQKGAGR